MTPLQRKFAQQNEPKEELTIEKTDTLRVARRADGTVAEIAELAKLPGFSSEPVRKGKYEKFDTYERLTEAGVSFVGITQSVSRYYENGQISYAMKRIAKSPINRGGGYSPHSVDVEQYYHVSGRPVSEKRRFPRFKKDVLIPVERTEYRGNEASYYGPDNELLARGPVDERRHATGFWQFPQEPNKDWQVGFFHENKRIASGASIEALSKDENVIEAMTQQGELPAPPPYEPF